MRTFTAASAVRDRRAQRADFERNVKIIEAAVGVPPAVLSCLEAMQRQIADLQVRVSELENSPRGTANPAEAEDGRPRPPGVWCRMREAVRRTNYSRSGLLKLCRQGKVRFDYEGAHRVIDITSVPRKFSQRSAQSEHCT
jgi:hypothetical protein